MEKIDFDAAFKVLTDNPPFPWQAELYRRFESGDIPEACDLPTGLGKTAVIPIWLIALSVNPSLPRRLVYVVNRRTVVDQSTREAVRVRVNLDQYPPLRDALAKLAVVRDRPPLAISTLRGQFADNREWCEDPARPAVVAGTVDMIGSRLLFSGYRCGYKSKPLHAGFLGQDALIVHDEAHLEPAFQRLLEAIRDEQTRCADIRPVKVMALTATPRDGNEPFGLTPADREQPEVRKRLHAVKRLRLQVLTDPKQTADEVARCALSYKDSGRAVLVFLRKVEDVEKVLASLRSAKQEAEQLTGTLRGLERDALATTNPIFARFMPTREEACETTTGTVYLVCTSAGEVGVNLSGDDLICDLTTFESMAQRFGRVNRFGDRDDTRVTVFHPAEFDEEDGYEAACGRTLDLLRRLGKDVSPAALGELPIADRRAAFAPRPTIVPTSDVLFDAWAATTVRSRLPGRPDVADWLHGLSGWEPPETHVAWRAEVGVVTPELPETGEVNDLTEACPPHDLLDDYPLKPHELLRDRTDRVVKHFDRMTKRLGERASRLRAWVVEPDGEVGVFTLDKLTDVPLNGRTVVLPPMAGGLSQGLLDGTAAANGREDVADEWFGEQTPQPQRPRDQDDATASSPAPAPEQTPSRRQRLRVWDEPTAEQRETLKGMRRVRSLDTDPDRDEKPAAEGRRMLRWYVRPRSADDDGSPSALEVQHLAPHCNQVGRLAAAFGKALDLGDLVRVLELAGRWHDAGKNRAVWQRYIGNPGYDPLKPETAWAKSAGGVGKLAESYRHEFGSLLDVETEPDFGVLSEGDKDVLLHLIAAHHGRARPHFPDGEDFDPGPRGRDVSGIVRDVPRRFVRLQRRFGRWGLAYIESLLRAADAFASRRPEGGSRD